MSHCTWVNPLCPDDLCVLEYGHKFTSRNHHITGTTPGSANVTKQEQDRLLADPANSKWNCGYMAPEGTPVEMLYVLGWKAQEEINKAAGR